MHAFLLVFVVTGVARLELFPFSAFRLFSEIRTSERSSWQFRAVDADGEEAPIRFGDLSIGYRQPSKQIVRFDDLSQRERDEICDAWTLPMREDGIDVARVRIYRLVGSVRPDGPPPERTLAYECGGGP